MRWRLGLLWLGLLPAVVGAEPPPLVLGQSLPLSGAARRLGRRTRRRR